MAFNLREKFKLSESKRIRNNYYRSKPILTRINIDKYFPVTIKIGKILIVITFITYFFIFCHDYLTQCEFFNSELIDIKGNRKLSEKEILELVQLYKGINILSVNLRKVRLQLLSNPWIIEAKVSRELPNIIHIEIREQEPLAILDIGKKFIINAGGNVFKELDNTDPEYLPVISGLQCSDLHISDSPGSAPYNAVMDILEIGRRPESFIPNCLIKKIQVDREVGITLYTYDRIKTIRLGYHDYRSKIADLKDIVVRLENSQFSNIEMIDLNRPERVVISPAKTESEGVERKEV